MLHSWKILIFGKCQKNPCLSVASSSWLHWGAACNVWQRFVFQITVKSPYRHNSVVLALPIYPQQWFRPPTLHTCPQQRLGKSPVTHWSWKLESVATLRLHQAKQQPSLPQFLYRTVNPWRWNPAAKWPEALHIMMQEKSLQTHSSHLVQLGELIISSAGTSSTPPPPPNK